MPDAELGMPKPKNAAAKSSKQRIEQAIDVAYAPEPLKLLNDHEAALWDVWILEITTAQIERGILGQNADDVAIDCAAIADELIRARRLRR